MRRLVFVVVAMLIAAPAVADPRADAEALFRIGAKAYKDGRFDAAAENFERSYELFKAPEIAFSAAQAHRLQYQADKDPIHVKRAIELFEIYVAATPKGGKRKDALAHLARLRDILSRIESSGQKVELVEKQTPSIYVSVALESALVTVDGKAVERYTSVEVAPGEHTVEVSADGYESIARKVKVSKGQAIVPVELVAHPAHVNIKTQNGAKVTVDGRPEALGGAPLAVTPGKRVIAVYAVGRKPVTRELDLAPGQEVTLDVPLHPTARRRAVKWVWIGDGVLGAATLTTAIVAIAANSSASDLRDSSTPLSGVDADRYLRLRDRRDNFRTASLVLGTATLATAATALWLYYFDRPSPEDLTRPVEHDQPSGGFAPLAITGGLGLGYGGSF